MPVALDKPEHFLVLRTHIRLYYVLRWALRYVALLLPVMHLVDHTVDTWLILPVVICLSQRLSHACLSISTYTVKLRMAH